MSIFAPRGSREMQSPLKDHVWPTAVRRPELRIGGWASNGMTVYFNTGCANRCLMPARMNSRSVAAHNLRPEPERVSFRRVSEADRQRLGFSYPILGIGQLNAIERYNVRLTFQARSTTLAWLCAPVANHDAAPSG